MKLGNRRHGHNGVLGKSPTYKSWENMKQRCLNPKHDRYRDYGGKGIRVCARWLSFENFLADMGTRPGNRSIDRYPNKDGNYEPGNCRWATSSEQNRNSARTRFTAEVVAEVIAWAAAGVPQTWLAEALGTTSGMISAMVKKQIWRTDAH